MIRMQCVGRERMFAKAEEICKYLSENVSAADLNSKYSTDEYGRCSWLVWPAYTMNHIEVIVNKDKAVETYVALRFG